MATPTVEQYVKTIYRIQRRTSDVASMKTLVDEMGVAPGTATAMAKHLKIKGLVDYEPRKGTRLTERGKSLALKVIRRHRLIETFLERFLNYDWSEVHTEAEELEHVVSDRFIERIDALMEHPEFDPHGDPIPDVQGRVSMRGLTPLSRCQPGDTCEVARLTEDGPAFLHAMKNCGVLPGATFRVVERNTDTQVMMIEPVGALAALTGKQTKDEAPYQSLSIAVAENVLVLPK